MIQHDFDVHILKQTIALADEAVKEGNHPFGAVLVGGDSQVLATAKIPFRLIAVRGMLNPTSRERRLAALTLTHCVTRPCTRQSSRARCVPVPFIGLKLGLLSLA